MPNPILIGYGNYTRKSILTNRLIVSLTFLCFLSIAGIAQHPELRMKYFSKDDGLFSTNINHVTQDLTGYIWVASQNGLFKYDGYHFTSYFSKQNDSTSLTNNYINYVFVDSKGSKWIGTRLGLCRYNEDLDNFERFPDFLRFSDIVGQNITQISEDHEGNIMMSCEQYLYKYSYQEKKFSQILNLPKGQINYFLLDKTNKVWIASSENYGLQRYNLNIKKWDPIIASTPELNALSHSIITTLALDNNKLWISKLGDGIQMLDIQTLKLVKYPYGNVDEGMAVFAYVDNNHHVWSVDYTALKILDKNSGNFIGYYPSSNNPYRIRGGIKGIFQDKQGNYWIYHSPGGIGVSTVLKGFQYFNSDLQGYWHTISANITALHEDDKGNLWIGNGEGGITVFDWEKGVTRNYLNNEKDKYSIGRGAVLCISRDSEGVIWISSYFGGLQSYDKTKDRFISYSHNPDDPESIAGVDVRAIVEDSEGNLWIGIHGKGIDKFDRKKNKFIHYNTKQNKLSNEWIYELLLDKKGNLWAATAWGLNYLKKGENTFVAYFSDLSDTASLTDNQINTICEDKNQDLWIGTPMGLNRFNPGKKNFTQFVNRFKSNYIAGILCDEQNNLWISTLSGISKYNFKNEEVHNFSSIDGLITEEFNIHSCYNNGKNGLFFGGTSGMVLFNPQNLVYNKIPPKVFIDKFKILNQEITFENSPEILQKPINLTSEITLHYTDNVITIQFKALNFINPQTNQYAYKLVGFDKKWNYVGTSNEATYTNLDPGKYVFMVRASNNDGVWNYKGTELKIQILPPWYRTIIFRIFVILFVIGLIVGYISYRTSKLEKQKILLENKVEEKTFELSEKNNLLKIQSQDLNEVNQLLNERKNLLEHQSEELKNQSESLLKANTELQNLNQTKDRLFSLIAHDLTSPFNSIIGFSELLVSNYYKTSDDDRISYAKAIYLSSEKLNAMLQSLLLWASSQINGIKCNPKKIQINYIIDDTIELTRANLKAKNIEINVYSADDIMVWADMEMLKTICRNLINNAIKFTPMNGTITVKVVPEQDEVYISITDTGVGIKQEKIDQILSLDIIKPEHGTEGEKGTGLGLALCKDFIKKNHGQLTITSEVGKGSTFSFNIPLSKNSSPN